MNKHFAVHNGNTWTKKIIYINCKVLKDENALNHICQNTFQFDGLYKAILFNNAD